MDYKYSSTLSFLSKPMTIDFYIFIALILIFIQLLQVDLWREPIQDNHLIHFHL